MNGKQDSPENEKGEASCNDVDDDYRHHPNTSDNDANNNDDTGLEEVAEEDDDDEEEQGGDTFAPFQVTLPGPALGETTTSPTRQEGSPVILLDRDSLDRVVQTYRRPGPPSIATTELASEVGSHVGAPKEAFLKSLTFLKDQPSSTMEWGLEVEARNSSARKLIWGRYNQKQRLFVSDVSGLVTLSKIRQGDYLKAINGHRIGPSVNAHHALDRMKHGLKNDGYLSIFTANKEDGDDILLQATIIKPREDMTYEQLGMKVWWWGYLCIKNIDDESIFAHTALKETDHIIFINDIDCDRMREKAFAHVINSLPYDITITVLRRKQRVSGKFG